MSLENYKKLQKLGEGTYGAVFKAQHIITNEVVAQKLVRMDQEEDGIPSTSLRELSILAILDHPNVISLKEVICDNGKITMILQYMDKDLQAFIDRSKSSVSEDLLLSYSFQLLCGLNYLQHQSIIHRDIKPENLLINRHGFLKITDFGSSFLFTHPVISIDSAMLWYRAPECLLSSDYHYGYAVDVWGAGCVIANLVLSHPLFHGDSPVDQMNQVLSIIGVPTSEEWPEFASFSENLVLPNKKPKPFESNFPKNTNPELIDLLQKMLTLNPTKRMLASEAVHHPYFRSIAQTLVDMCLHSE